MISKSTQVNMHLHFIGPLTLHYILTPTLRGKPCVWRRAVLGPCSVLAGVRCGSGYGWTGTKPQIEAEEEKKPTILNHSHFQELVNYCHF